MKKNILNNSDGILTADYMFAIVLAMGFMIILFSLSMTMTMVDVVQYMTFSSARVYTVANLNEEASEGLARAKFSQLYSNPAIKPLFDKAKWFELLGGELQVGDLTDEFPSSGTGADRNTFYGVSVGLRAKMLDIKIPFYGSTNNREDGKGFSTEIHTFLGRESSIEECQNFSAKRLEFLYEYYQHSALQNTLQNYINITDNGC